MKKHSYRLLLTAWLAALASLSSAQTATTAPYTPDSGNITIRCGQLIDGIRAEAFESRTIAIEDGRFVSTDSGATTVDLDLSGYTCLPGLIDTHTHIAEPAETADLSIFYKMSLEESLAAGRENAAVTLAAGFTTVRNLGTYIGWTGRALRDEIDRGEVIGPRMQIAGFYLTIPGGGGDLVIPGHDEEEIPAHIRLGVARGAADFRRKAERAVAGGAGVLKLIASGAVLAFGGVPGAPEMTEEEIRAAVEVGHAAGLTVTAHAHGAQSIKDAIAAGVDSIEHASLADDEAIRMAAANNVAFSMDVYNGSYIGTVGREQDWPAEFLRKNDETTEAQREVFEKAHAAGVRITYGTDSGVYPHGDNARQFSVMVVRGMAPMEAIKAATSVAAEVIGWQDDVGAIAVGRYGDLIAVRGDPLQDIGELQNVAIVVKGGVIVSVNADQDERWLYQQQ